MGTIISVANQKGGVGKTTTALDIVSFLLSLGKKVCIYDMDAQATFTKRVFNVSLKNPEEKAIPASVRKKAGEANVLGLFDEDFEGVPFPVKENLWIFGATSHISMANTCTDEEVDLFIKNTRAVAQDFDYVIIDCPPMIGSIQFSSLSASDFVVVPAKLEKGSAEGMARLFSVVTLCRQKKNPDLKVAGIFLNLVKSPKTLVQKQMTDEIREIYGELVFNTELKETTKVTEAEYYNQSILDYSLFDANRIGVPALMAEIMSKVEA